MNQSNDKSIFPLGACVWKASCVIIKDEGDSEKFPIWVGGVIFGAVACGILWELISMGSIIEFVHKYQTLIAGLIAFIGALITVRHIQKQIERAQAHHDDIINRNLTAARSVLPLVLSDLHKYAVACIAMALDVARRRELSQEFSIPLAGTFDVFREVIKYAPHERQLQMAKLLSHLQVQISRFSHTLKDYEPLTAEERLYPEGIGFGDENILAFDDIFDAEELLVRVDDLYAFARGEDDENNLSRFERFKSNFIQHDIFVADWPNLMAHGERRLGQEN